MPQSDGAREINPYTTDWDRATDFSPHILPASVEEETPVEEVDPKDLPAPESVISPESLTPSDLDSF